MPGPSARTRAGVAAASTFNSISLSWRTPGGGADVKASVRFRREGTGGWRSGFPLAYDARSDRRYGGEYRGSLVGLQPGATYVVRLTLEGSSRTVTIKRRTWSERVPVARTIRVSPSRATPDLKITKGGSPNGFVLYIPSAKTAAELKVPTSRPSAVSVEASYVIVRGFKIRGGRDGIHVGAGRHDVIIERNDISGWGRIASDAGKRPDGTAYATPSARLWGEDRDAAIGCDGGPAERSINRVVIQGNRLHDPATGSNSWTQARPQSTNGHPFGPQAVDANDCGSNWVIRRNEISSGPGHYFNDGIGGAANFSDRGFPFADADIAENRISHCRDDGIEAEGANRNVRIWGNYIDKTFTKVAIAPTQVGPIYIWRNVADRSAQQGAKQADQAQRGPFLKAGSRDSRFPGGGHIHIFNNTVLQRQPRQSQRLGLGPSYGLAESAGPVLNIVSRNNILLVPSSRNYSVLHQTPPAADGESDFDYDLYNGLVYVKGVTRPEPHGIRAASGSAGIDKGQRIPNFTDGFRGAGPDIGAQEHGAPPLRFGLTARRAA
jgi:Right handed beta helix region